MNEYVLKLHVVCELTESDVKMSQWNYCVMIRRTSLITEMLHTTYFYCWCRYLFVHLWTVDIIVLHLDKLIYKSDSEVMKSEEDWCPDGPSLLLSAGLVSC